MHAPLLGSASLPSIFSASGKNGRSLTSVPSVFIYLLLRAIAVPEILPLPPPCCEILVFDVVMGPSVELLKSPVILNKV